MHKESGPVYKWHLEHLEDEMERLGANLDGDGPGILRKIPQKDLDEIKAIYDVTGGTERIETVVRFSEQKAAELGMTPDEYLVHTFTHNSGHHTND